MSDRILPLMKMIDPATYSPDALPRKLCDWCQEYDRPDTEAEAVREALTALRAESRRWRVAANGLAGPEALAFHLCADGLDAAIDARLKP